MSVEYDVAGFMASAGQLDAEQDKHLIDLRISLIEEEANELIEALRWGDRRFIAKEAADLVYVAVGTAVALGIPFSEVWDIVHEANMSKFADGDAAFREDGKVVKGPSYHDPAERIAKIVKP